MDWQQAGYFLVIAIVGTTIAPWQLFFQQSCIADKRLRFSDLRWARLDTFVGAVFTILVAGCMMLAGNAAFRIGGALAIRRKWQCSWAGVSGRF
jgi:Mn2+/Fe2+ NRAMP family transporter